MPGHDPCREEGEGMKKGDPIYSKINRENIVSAMTTNIPPLEERQKRRGSDDCVFFDGEYMSCKLYDISGCESNCDANFTQTEMQELIDEHNAKEATQ